VTAFYAVQIGLGVLRPDLDPTALFLTVPDAHGTYTIPYIQAADHVDVAVEFRDARLVRARLALVRDGRPAATRLVTRERPVAAFESLRPGEYALRTRGLSRGDEELCRSEVTRLGIGTVIAALGDSITEGYYGRGYNRGPDLAARDFPSETVSRDGRNFPQFSPTTAWHLPEVTCFESWMTDLNDLLTDAWRHPVFLANEGWGGYTTEAYLNLMRTDADWQARLRLLQPTVWLIHLGVNDERAQVPPETFVANLRAIVQILADEYYAQPRRVLIAKPCYDYFEGAEPILRGYCVEIDRLVAELGLSSGPDLFAAYAADRERWYGADPVHPNVEGMQRMAALWHAALVAALPEG
jgi:lysophospholipase L1-like esterase